MTEVATNGTPAEGGAVELWRPGEAPAILATELEDARTAEQITESLRALADHELAKVAVLERELEAARGRARRYERALNALDPAPPKPAKKSLHAGVKRANGGSWNVSARKVEMVYERFAEFRAQHPDQPITAGWLADQTPGLSSETARRALHDLREQERVRIVGVGRGGGKQWDLMPGGDDAA